ncbi:hypothetical protein Pen02_08320 [Plantactinospora endophytica]|uniref:Uncharacterized protein n=1 Tax=Plantactinospora endophytica TaxID=673535 RepID=A0ABQ4DTW2_9ACTN|nr:hypothetical protein Pen02_08320 [Plantactinospora endophytica]
MDRHSGAWELPGGSRRRPPGASLDESGTDRPSHSAAKGTTPYTRVNPPVGPDAQLHTLT